MDKHYYLVSQLPSLQFDREPFFSVESFLEEAGKWMNRREYSLLVSCRLFQTSLQRNGISVYDTYLSFEERFSRELAEWRREQKKGQERKLPPELAALVSEGDPLIVEKMLLKARWDFLDESVIEHHFDLSFLVVYFLKLQILEKLAEYDPEKGRDVYQRLITPDLDPFLGDHSEDNKMINNKEQEKV